MAARVHVTDTYDVPDTDDADADTDDDAGPCEDIVVLAKTHNGASEDTYCRSGTSTTGLEHRIQVRNPEYRSEPRIQVPNPEYRSGTSHTGPELRIQVRNLEKNKNKIKDITLYIK